MLDELNQIDMSAVAELRRLTDEKNVVSSRLTAMESKRGMVSQAVFDRVRGDYQQRLAALDERARPLQASARAESAKLDALRDRLEARLREASLVKEEIEFRHALGEFEEAVYAARGAEADEALGRCQAELAETDEVRARFVEAFGSEAELEAAGAPAPFESAVAAPPPPFAPDVSEEATLLTESPVGGAMALPPIDSPTVPGGLGGVAVATGVTRPMPPDVVGGALPGAPEGELVVGGPGEGEGLGAAALAVAHLVTRFGDGREEAFALQLGTTTIGRSPKNDICLRDSSVSRQHAKIVFTDRGFMVYDLGSENGVYVNGDRVTHRLLSEGDELEFGPGLQPFVFRAP